MLNQSVGPLSVLVTDVVMDVDPMLAEAGRPEVLESLRGTHVFDEKLDGIRALAAWDSGDFVLRNRNGTDITYRYPEIVLGADQGSGRLILDGEIMALSGSFEDIGWRDKQSGRGAGKVPAHFVAFDVLWHPEHGDVRHRPYAERRLLLNALPLTEPFIVSRVSTDPGFFDHIKAEGGEGVVAKRIRARYARGRSSDWLKVKTIYSITAMAVGYEPGAGSRSDLGALMVATLTPTDGGAYDVRALGRVGSGFSPTTATEMRNLIEAARTPSSIDINKLPIVEVECLGITRNGVLRQPVYKGLRTDRTWQHATTDQLDPIPTR